MIFTFENVNVFHLSVPTDMIANRLRPPVGGTSALVLRQVSWPAGRSLGEGQWRIAGSNR